MWSKSSKFRCRCLSPTILVSQVASLDVKIKKNYLLFPSRSPNIDTCNWNLSLFSSFGAIWKWDSNFQNKTKSGPIKLQLHSFLCFSCLTFDGYQLNMIEITGFSHKLLCICFLYVHPFIRCFEINWINKFD